MNKALALGKPPLASPTDARVLYGVGGAGMFWPWSVIDLSSITWSCAVAMW